MLLDGEPAGHIRGAPWRTEVDLGRDPLPHTTEARALGPNGALLGSARELLSSEGAHASVEVLIEGCWEGVCTAGAVWSTFPPAPPAAWRATVGGRPLKVEDPGRFSYPCRPPGTEILTVELDFPAGRVARTAVPCGGAGHVASSDLTALPVVV